MRVYKATIYKEYYLGSEIEEVQEEIKIEIPSKPSELTVKKWSDFHVYRENLPEWAKVEDEEQLKDWDAERWHKYIVHIAELLKIVSGCDLNSLLGLEFNSDNSILTIYAMFCQDILNYKPSIKEVFIHKGIKFAMPKNRIDRFGRTSYGTSLNTGQAIEALQGELMFNQKDEKGNYFLQDRKYHTDVMLLATLSRKIMPDGSLEVAPIGFDERSKWLDERCEFFSDAPLNLALDMDFFLLSSKKAYMNTLISHLSLPATSTM